MHRVSNLAHPHVLFGMTTNNATITTCSAVVSTMLALTNLKYAGNNKHETWQQFKVESADLEDHYSWFQFQYTVYFGA